MKAPHAIATAAANSKAACAGNVAVLTVFDWHLINDNDVVATVVGSDAVAHEVQQIVEVLCRKWKDQQLIQMANPTISCQLAVGSKDVAYPVADTLPHLGLWAKRCRGPAC